jgi:hypothetical protein
MSSSNAYDEYLAAFERGRRLCRLLDSFFRTDRTQYPTMQSLYSVDSDLLRMNATRDIQRALAGCGVSTSELVYVDVRSPGKSAYDDAAYTNHLDGKSGVIVCSENYKDRDDNAPGQKLWPSEILWQSWMMAVEAQRSRPSDLQVIVRFRVVNESTMSMIWHAARLSTCIREGLHHYREYTKWDQGYHAILGSVNGASAVRMLLDHKALMGYRTVERVVVLGDKKLTLEEPERRSFMLLLSPRRIPPTRIPRPPSTTRRMIRLERSSSGSGGNIRFNRTAQSDAGHSITHS